MYYRLNLHLQINNILVREQYGFSKGVSTEHAAYSLTNSIVSIWNNKFHVGGIFCDLTKAFDCVNHNILIMQLQYNGLHDANMNWFKSYLSLRKQSKFTYQQPPRLLLYLGSSKTGVLQGAILGQLLFIVY
jgi:hypothetical protein